MLQDEFGQTLLRTWTTDAIIDLRSDIDATGAPWYRVENMAKT